jgi:AAA domain
MALKIITADQRLHGPRGVKALIIGPAGVGKTSLLRTIDPKSTLFVDLEAGDLSVLDVPCDTLRPKTWDECRDLAAFLGGPNPALPAEASYSQAHFKRVTQAMGDGKSLDKYTSYFVDSITVAGRLCFRWASQQPEAISDKTGKPDLRGAYGLHAREMIAWLVALQHVRAKNVIFIGILEHVADEFHRGIWQPQIEGSKTGRELPGIVDQVITMQFLQFEEGEKPVRALVCQQPNQWNYPAKDRSGRLELYEKPHLGELIEKVTANKPKLVAA